MYCKGKIWAALNPERRATKHRLLESYATLRACIPAEIIRLLE